MKKKTVLIAGSNSKLLNKVAENLNGEFIILKAPNGKVAWEILEKRDISCAIIDVDMPVMNGLVLLGKLRMNGYHTTVIMANGRDIPEYRDYCFKLGASQYITESSDPSDILENLKTSMEEREGMVPY